MGYITAYYAWMKNDGAMLRIKLAADASQNLNCMLSASIDILDACKKEEYSDYKLDNDEAYVIEGFSSLPEGIENTLTPINSETLVYLEYCMDDIIAFVFPYIKDNTQCYAFQAPRKETKTLRGGIKLFLERDTFTIDNRILLTVTGDVDCIVTGTTAVFRSEYYMQRVFSLSEYYREATRGEVETFVRLPSLHFESGDVFTAMAEDKIIRRRIGFLLDCGFFTNQPIDAIQAKAQQIIPGLSIVANDRIHFPNNKSQCKQLLKMFCDEVYRGVFSNEVFETNSKKRVNS